MGRTLGIGGRTAGRPLSLCASTHRDTKEGDRVSSFVVGTIPNQVRLILDPRHICGIDCCVYPFTSAPCPA